MVKLSHEPVWAQRRQWEIGLQERRRWNDQGAEMSSGVKVCQQPPQQPPLGRRMALSRRLRGDLLYLHLLVVQEVVHIVCLQDGGGLDLYCL